MTIQDFLRGASTLDQLEILARADAHIYVRNSQGRRVGRYYGGQLSSYEEKALTIERKVRYAKTS